MLIKVLYKALGFHFLKVMFMYAEAVNCIYELCT